MLASEKLIRAMNDQVGHEFAASLQYVSIASYFEADALPELGTFFHRQALEEREHAMKFVKFIVDSGGRLEIPAIPAPKATFESAEEAVGLALENEEKVTRQIYGLVEIANADSDYIAQRFLDWFVTEQFEEVTTMSELLQVVRRAGNELLRVEEYLARVGDPHAAE